MNDITGIVTKINDEAESGAAELLSAARTNAEGIARSYEERAGRETAATLSAAEAAARAVRQRADSQSGIDSRNALLSARRAVLSRAFDEAQKRLAALPDKEKTDLYARIAAGNATADAEIVLNQADRAAIGGAVLSAARSALSASGKEYRLTLAEESGDFAGGLVLRQGRMEINCTFEVMVSDARGELEAETLQVLFGK